MNQIKSELNRLLQDYIDLNKTLRGKKYPRVPYEECPRSPLYIAPEKSIDADGYVEWTFKEKTSREDYNETLSEALPTKLHKDLIDYYNSAYFCELYLQHANGSGFSLDPILPNTERDEIQQLFVWSEQHIEPADRNRLLLIGGEYGPAGYELLFDNQTGEVYVELFLFERSDREKIAESLLDLLRSSKARL